MINQRTLLRTLFSLGGLPPLLGNRRNLPAQPEPGDDIPDRCGGYIDCLNSDFAALHVLAVDLWILRIAVGQWRMAGIQNFHCRYRVFRN